MTHKKDLKKLDEKLDELKTGNAEERGRYHQIEAVLRRLAR